MHVYTQKPMCVGPSGVDSRESPIHCSGEEKDELELSAGTRLVLVGHTDVVTGWGMCRGHSVRLEGIFKPLTWCRHQGSKWWACVHIVFSSGSCSLATWAGFNDFSFWR